MRASFGMRSLAMLELVSRVATGSCDGRVIGVVRALVIELLGLLKDPPSS